MGNIQGHRQRGGQWCPAPHLKSVLPPFHVWPPGCCIHPIQYLKNVPPPFWFLAPPFVFWPPIGGALLLNPGDGPGNIKLLLCWGSSVPLFLWLAQDDAVLWLQQMGPNLSVAAIHCWGLLEHVKRGSIFITSETYQNDQTMLFEVTAASRPTAVSITYRIEQNTDW